MFFSLEVLKALHGDCLLLHFGSPEEPGLILIDGGPYNVYQPYLKPRLKKIRDARGLSETQQLPVDLLLVSHVDRDHIIGVLDLMKEEKKAKSDKRPRRLRIKRLWHNSFDNLIRHDAGHLTGIMQSHFGPAAASGGGELPEDKKREVAETCSEDPEVVAGCLKVLASIGDGIHLNEDANMLGIERNPGFDNQVILASQNGEPKIIPPQGLTFTVMGPMASELEDLRQKDQSWLEAREREPGKPATQALAAYVDKTIENLSSIVLLAELSGKRMLLTGDARGDKILEGLQLTGRLDTEKDSTIEVDLLKVPHHGSARNLDLDFFQRIIAKHYVFSANGKDGNPDRETMEMVWKARGAADYTIHLTYEIKEIDEKRKTENTDWSPEQHSLEAFFKEHNMKVDPDPVEEGKPYISIVKEGKPHIIDLLEDKVGF
jgi:beta-lactamase superfamily II metal-dependent hydrolase